MSVYKILETGDPGGHERRSRDVGSVRTEAGENSTSPPWPDNDSDNGSADYKSKSTAIPAISLIKDFFGNHEKNEELEDITPANSSHHNWLDVEESFKYSNFSISHPNTQIKSPFLVDTAYSYNTETTSNKFGDSQDVKDNGGAVYSAVHDAVTNLLTNNDIESDLVSKLHHLLGRKSFCQVGGPPFISISFL